MRRGFELLLVALVLLGGTACSDDDAAERDDLAGHTFVATSFLEGDDTVVLDAPGGPGTLTFEADGSVAGSDGCNRFGFDAYSIDGGELRFEGPQFGTLVGCLDQAYETRFRAILQGPVDYSIDGDELVITTPAGRGVVFTAGD